MASRRSRVGSNSSTETAAKNDFEFSDELSEGGLGAVAGAGDDKHHGENPVTFDRV
jgi:hypothetical protein